MILVTGAGGRLGRLLRAVWPAQVPVIWSGRAQGLDLQWDVLADPPPAALQGAVVLHLAGVVRGSEAELNKNVALGDALGRAAQAAGARAILTASTAAVYRPGPVAASEDTPPEPVGAYGRSKLAAEAAVRTAAPDLQVTVLRLGNVVGAEALLGPRTGTGAILLDPVPGTDGGPVRSWIGPVALARLLADLAMRPDALPPMLNVAADPPLAMADLLRASGLPWAFGPPNPAVVPVATMNCDRLAALHAAPPATPEGLIAELRQAR